MRELQGDRMVHHKIIDQIRSHRDTVLAQDSPLGVMLWHELLRLHPADIAQCISQFDYDDVIAFFLQFPEDIRIDVFNELYTNLKIACFAAMNDHDRRTILSHLSIDEVTDFFDELSDDQLKEYIKYVHTKDREELLSLLQFTPDSAGGSMETDVLTLMQDFTVEKSVSILQRLQPKKLLQQIYVTDQHNQLVGHINLEDLLSNHPKARISSFLQPNELVVQGDEDREEVAKQMLHYNLNSVPVVDDENVFLGVIAGDTVAEIIEEEASEDIYRLAAMAPIRHTYFETPFFKLLYQRSSILLILLIAQSISSVIMHYYEHILAGFLMIFVPMLISTGGNTSNQSSTLVIQGMATGEIDDGAIWRFIKREMLMAVCIATLLGLFSFVRIYFTYGKAWASFAVSLSLGCIVMCSVVLGSCMPILLKKLNMDPAHSAGPLLATLMDIIGLTLYCTISSFMLR